MTVKVAVIYYSATGTVHALAQAVAEGADDKPWHAGVAEAPVEDLAWADAVAFGTPTRFGTPPAATPTARRP
ncbi:flavodoxin domain-containing protein [Dactylosporangium sp. NPDC049525]|uniref:flavodoxin domain-containing protein n=1 Tax=Dactylosporangium sp. NPDC049525 TaxID=3154730 RepID=UPI003443F9D6